MSLDPFQKNALLASLLYPKDDLKGLSALSGFLSPSPPALQGNALAALLYPSTASGLAALSAPPVPRVRPVENAFLNSSLLGSAATAQPVKRRVFFSFHYQNDINRVNVVRKSWVFRPADKSQPAEFFDHSLWESTKRTGPAALKKLIRSGMQNSSVTCVLAGQETWARPWVRYEIVQSITRGNGLLTVHIDGVKCMNNGYAARGRNPLDYMGLYWADDAKAYLCENFRGAWRLYPLHTEPVSWPAYLPNATALNVAQPLSKGAFEYDYARQNGYANMSVWAQRAADRAGR